jgi:hypothetical protein
VTLERPEAPVIYGGRAIVGTALGSLHEEEAVRYTKLRHEEYRHTRHQTS